METTTIRVPAPTRDRLNALARRWGASAGDVVTRLVDRADDEALLAEATRGWDRLARDPAALGAYRSEAGGLEAFDAPLPDY